MTEIRIQTDISAVNLKTNELTTDIAPLREGGQYALPCAKRRGESANTYGFFELYPCDFLKILNLMTLIPYAPLYFIAGDS